MAGMAEAIRQIMQEKGISEELVLQTIKDSLTAAYKKRFGTAENIVIRFKDNYDGVEVFSKKLIVQEAEDPVLEIELDEAREYAPEAEVGDILEVPIDLKEFDLQSVMLAKQTTRQSFKEITRDALYADFHAKLGEIIIGYYQREKNGNIFVDLGKAEGFFPKKYQSPLEVYQPGDRIKALIVEVNKTNPQIVLSRTHPEFVQKILELEVPEVYDKTVEVYKIVREPGYRTKIAVFSRRDDIDPVGACVGLKGIRIQNIIKELEGEKIDILRYDPNPEKFIKNALLPANVLDVYVLDETKRQALAVVSDEQFSIAIGKQGLNVRLANRLCDWTIDVKTEEQFKELDIGAHARKMASNLFEAQEEEIVKLSELPDVDMDTVAILAEHGIELIEEFLEKDEEELLAIPGLTQEQIDAVRAIIEENVEIVEEEIAEEEVSEEEEYECPECHARITPDMTHCPQCGVELAFEYEDDDEQTPDEE